LEDGHEGTSLGARYLGNADSCWDGNRGDSEGHLETTGKQVDVAYLAVAEVLFLRVGKIRGPLDGG
jgi:hypothetical protein